LWFSVACRGSSFFAFALAFGLFCFLTCIALFAFFLTCCTSLLQRALSCGSLGLECGATFGALALTLCRTLLASLSAARLASVTR
jgi:hypothetical protein